MGEDKSMSSTDNTSARINWDSFVWDSSGTGEISLPDVPEPKFECEECGNRYRKQQHKLERFGWLVGYCPTCFLSAIAEVVDAPELRERGEDS